MARPRTYKIELTDDELKSTIRKNKTSKTIQCRCQIIIDLAETHGKVFTHEQSAKSNGVYLLLPNRLVEGIMLACENIVPPLIGQKR